MELWRSQYGPISLKALKKKRFQILRIVKKSCKASGRQVPHYKEETADQVVLWVADGKYPAAFPLNENENHPIFS